jgi:hypothetical protein
VFGGMLLAMRMVEEPACAGSTQGRQMSPISAIQSSIVTAVGRTPREAMPRRRETTQPQTSECRALIPLEPIVERDPPLRARPRAPYLAHLIATKEKAPQTCERRRADPAVAIAAYAAAQAGPDAPAGGKLAREM